MGGEGGQAGMTAGGMGMGGYATGEGGEGGSKGMGGEGGSKGMGSGSIGGKGMGEGGSKGMGEGGSKGMGEGGSKGEGGSGYKGEKGSYSESGALRATLGKAPSPSQRPLFSQATALSTAASALFYPSAARILTHQWHPSPPHVPMPCHCHHAASSDAITAAGFATMAVGVAAVAGVAAITIRRRRTAGYTELAATATIPDHDGTPLIA